MNWWRKQDDRDLDQEIRFHLAEEARLRIDRGEPESSARESARRDFGNVGLVKEITKDMWGWRSIEVLWKDLTYGVRQLRRSPGFTAVAVITLALGIGVNTAMFSVVNAFLFRPLPVPEPNQIAVLASSQKGGALVSQFSIPDYYDIQQGSTSLFSGLAAYQIDMSGLLFDGKTSHAWVNFVTGNYFTILGLQPALGRLILPSEGKTPGADPVVVLGYSYWQQNFASDRNVVGRKVMINGHPGTIVGVAPRGFHGLYAMIETQAFMPLGMATVSAGVAADFMSDRAFRNMAIFGRWKPGVTLRQSEAALRVVAARLGKDNPKLDDGLEVHAFAERSTRPDPASSSQISMVGMLFLALSALVLVLACINVANILLVRASVRQREMAVRAALGAGRVRLVRQLLTESLLLSLIGGACGIALGLWCSNLLASVNIQAPLPILMDFHFDWSVFGFAFCVAISTGALMGLIPAIRASRGDLADVLHNGGRTIVVGRNRLRSTLVAAQVGGSLMLLIVAALFTRSLWNAQSIDLGFDFNHVINVIFDTDDAGYKEAQGRQFSKELLQRVSALPGVEKASIAFSIPMGYFNASNVVQVPGYEPPSGKTAPTVGYNVVSPGFFETMRIPILRGRAIDGRDNENSPHVAVINEEMAEHFWPHQDPIGRQFQMLDDPKHVTQVIGVARNSRVSNFTGAYHPFAYVPQAQMYTPLQTLHVRSSRPPEAIIPDIEKTIHAIAPGVPIVSGQPMRQALETLNGLLVFRLGAGLAAALGFLGLALAVVGLYGVVSYAAAQRTHEIGIRMALGAKGKQILTMIVRQGIAMIGAGLAFGLVLAFGVSKVVGQFLIGVSGTDPLTIGVVTLILAVVSLAACYVPALRATRVDPMKALRTE